MSEGLKFLLGALGCEAVNVGLEDIRREGLGCRGVTWDYLGRLG